MSVEPPGQPVPPPGVVVTAALLVILEQNPLGREKTRGRARPLTQDPLVDAALNNQSRLQQLSRLQLSPTAQPGKQLPLPLAPAA